MADRTDYNLSYIATMAVVIVGMIAVSLRLLPILLQVLLQIVPPILVLWFIVFVLRGMIKQLLP